MRFSPFQQEVIFFGRFYKMGVKFHWKNFYSVKNIVISKKIGKRKII